jgi:hypothetical protein
MQPEKPKYHGQEDRDAIALAIGKIVMAWNEFHETLAGISPKSAAGTNGRNR